MSELEQKECRGRIIPEGELKCVWMTAGLIAYKLCDYSFECERCPFDAVMRKAGAQTPSEEPSSEMVTVAARSEGTAPEIREAVLKLLRFTVKKGLFYHPGHTWVEVINGQKAKVGINDFAAKMVRHIKAVILPRPGSPLVRGHVGCWIVADFGTLPITAPLNGQVLSINTELLVDPWRVTASPYEQGWLMEVACEDLSTEVRDLVSGERALAHLESEAQKLARKLEGALTREPKLGRTLQDGGARLDDLKEMLGSKKCYEIISPFFSC